MSGLTTLVTVLSSSVRTVLHNMTNLVTVIAGILLLFTVPGNMTCSMAPVAAVLLLLTVTG